MIYGGDKAIELPVKDLYDTSMMIASINAAKDLYDLGVTLIKDFSKTYGDFYSPIGKDVDYWYKNTTGKVKDVINYLYQNGIDPTRSAEGRAMIALTINLAPAAELAKMRQSSEAAKEYQKNRAVLEAAGKFNPLAEAYFLRDANGNPRTMEQWDTEKDGPWTRTSPTANQSMFDLVNPITQDMKPTFDTNLSKDGYEYYTITRDNVQKKISPVIQDIKQTPFGGYYYKQYLDAAGGDALKADAAFMEDLISASGKPGTYERKGDQVWMHKDSQQFQHNESVLQRNWQSNENLKDRDQKERLSKNGGGSGGGVVTMVGSTVIGPNGDSNGQHKLAFMPTHDSSYATSFNDDGTVKSVGLYLQPKTRKGYLDANRAYWYPDRSRVTTYTYTKNNKKHTDYYMLYHNEKGESGWFLVDSPVLDVTNGSAAKVAEGD